MSKTTNDFCSAEKIQICISKNKICNTKTGRCINKPKTNASAKSNIVTNTTIDNSSSDKVSTSTKKVINTKKTILDFIKELGKKKYKTAEEVINDIFNKKEDYDDAIKVINEIVINEFNEVKNNASKKGYIYELLWDICIKFGITDFTKEKSEHAIGNFNIFHNFKNIKEYINEYLKQGYISSNSGGYSDITFRTKEQNKDTQYNLNLVSVKYIKGKDIKNYDIQNLCTLIRDRENDDYKSINTLLFVKDKEDFKKICKSANQSSNVLIKYISPQGNYENVYDLQDLEKNYSNLLKVLELYNFLYDEPDKEKFKKNFLNVKEKILKPFVPRFHQQLIIKSIQKHINKEKKILVGAIPRSGKTYIMAGTILEDVKKNPINTFKNYIIITPAPTETLSQYEDAFNDYIDFKEKNIEVVNVKNEGTFKKHENKNIVYIVSKQKLGIYNNDNEDELKNDKNKAQKIADKLIKLINGIKFEIIFYDEAHYGMSTTTAAEYIFKNIKSKDQKEIYVTATYNKPTNVYKITRIFNWGLQDINFLDNYKNNKIDKLIEYFSKNFDLDIVKDVVENNFNNKIDYITKDYKHFPKPFLLTSVWHKDFLDEQLKLLEGESNYGFDMDKLFTYFKDGITFENETQLKILFEYYLGYPIKNGSIENIKYFKFKEIENNNNDRTNISQDEKYKELNKIDIENDTINKSNSIYKNILQEYKNIYYEKDSKIYIPIPKYKYKNRDYKDVDFLKKRGIIPRIREVCMNECRTLQHVKHKTSQLWFLPGGTPGRLLDNIIFSLLYFLKNNFNDFFKSHMFFICRNESEIKTKKKSDKQEIKDKVERNETEYKKLKKNFENICFQDDEKFKTQKDDDIKTQKDDDIKTQIKNIENYIKKEDKYRGLIILTGGKLKLGVSLPNVDIVTLFSNTMSTDSIFQMLFRSMTEIEDNTKCNITEYCPKKKYGFMVDLKPQRILRILRYINTKILSKEQQDNKNKKEYIPIGDLINIDKDVFINKYDYNKSKKEIKKEIKYYSEAYLEKLLDTNDYSNNKDIKNIIDLYDFDLNKFDKDILWYLQNFHLEKAAFDKKSKEKVIPTGKKVEKKSKKDDDDDDGGEDDDDGGEDDEDGEYKSKDIVKDGEDKDINEINKNLKDIVLISISLLSLICDNYCLFDNKNNKINMIEINKIFEDMKGNKKNICNNDGEDNLKDIFINGFKDRITNNIPSKSNEDMFNLIKDIFSNIKEKDDYINGGRKKIGGNILSLNHLLKSQRQKIYTIETPDKLLEQINETIPFTKKAKDERGEVFTPMTLVNEMLDTLPKEVWKNPNLKWLDPASGMGNFPVAVYMRLMEGLKYVKGYEDEEKRRKHILENMLYMVEIDKTNVFMMRKIFCGKIYKLNIFEGSFIEGKNIEGIDYTKEEIYNNNGFDIIVGNPPYNQGGVGKGGGVFWKYFVDKSFKILNNNGYILMIHPTGWRKPTSINASAGDIWKLIKKYNLIFLKISDKKIPGFPRVDYYVLNKNTNQQDTEVINIFELNQITKSSLNLYTLPFIPHLINKEVLSIINKILNKKGERFNIIYNQVIKPKKGDKITVGVPHAHYFDINNKNYQEKYSLYLTKPDYISHPKIIMTYNSGKKPAYLYAKYYSKELGTTNNTMYQIIKKADNKNNLVTFLNSRLIHFILKITQYSSPPNYKNEFNILNMFAKPNEDNITKDEDIYDYFKLTRKEINLIEENTKGFDKITGGLNNKYKKYKLDKYYLNRKSKYNSI